MARRIERGRFCVAAALAAMLLPTEALACDLPPPESASVAAVLAGKTLKLADGRIVKLIGAKARVAPLGWHGDDPWPFVEEAKAALEALAAKRSNFTSAEAAPTGMAIFSPRSSPLRAIADCCSSRNSWGRVLLGFIRSPTIAPARANCSRVRKRRGKKRLGLWASSAYRIEDAGDAERLGRLIHSY